MAVKQEYIDILVNIQGFKVGLVGTVDSQDGSKILMIEMLRIERKYRCPCGREFDRYYDGEERDVRDLSYGIYKKACLVFYQVRVDCPDCGVVTEQLDWVGRRVHYTKRLAAAVALACRELRSTKSVAEQFDLHVHTVKAIEKSALEEDLPDVSQSNPEFIGVDEFALRKGHNYATTVVDLDGKTVPYVGEGRTKESLSTYYEALGESKCASIKAVAMDMWPAYEEATLEYCPNAEIVFDPFHIISSYGREVVDKVRLMELRQANDHDKEFIKGSKYLLLKNHENLNPAKDEPARLADLLSLNRRLSTVYMLKDDLKQLWKYRSEGWALKWFNGWYRRAIYSKIEPLKIFARRLKGRLDGILAHCRYPIHTSLIEGVNNKIKVIKRVSFGLSDTEYFFLKIRGAFADR